MNLGIKIAVGGIIKIFDFINKTIGPDIIWSTNYPLIDGGCLTEDFTVIPVPFQIAATWSGKQIKLSNDSLCTEPPIVYLSGKFFFYLL